MGERLADVGYMLDRVAAIDEAVRPLGTVVEDRADEHPAAASGARALSRLGIEVDAGDGPAHLGQTPHVVAGARPDLEAPVKTGGRSELVDQSEHRATADERQPAQQLAAPPSEVRSARDLRNPGVDHHPPQERLHLPGCRDEVTALGGPMGEVVIGVVEAEVLVDRTRVQEERSARGAALVDKDAGYAMEKIHRRKGKRHRRLPAHRTALEADEVNGASFTGPVIRLGFSHHRCVSHSGPRHPIGLRLTRTGYGIVGASGATCRADDCRPAGSCRTMGRMRPRSSLARSSVRARAAAR